ncbi:hypothetical protein IGI04_018090 [Brassica rapa subsp. trilocularis]|uniref:Uncharacterized protein n=1 Tax=Brassica rapa subsp. trilocularis TaxID=1813537 RepID=A0ABQ7MFK0_BRACM|nr:hypothetical protein IGI04_018090 [Brassica rapa subsp. trilocularis]
MRKMQNSHRNQAKSDTTFQMLLFELKSCAKVSEILEELKKDPERHGGPPDCIAISAQRVIQLFQMLLLELKILLKVSERYFGLSATKR